MRRQHDWLLAAQQSRQHRPPPGREMAREVGGQQRQRARQDIRQDQVMMPPAYCGVAVSREVADPRQAGDGVARDIVAGDHDRARIDIAGRYLAPQQLGGGDRQDSGPGADIQRMGYSALLRQGLQGQQTTAGRGMLAGAEGGRRIERDADRPCRHPAAMMRAVDKEAADPQRRKG